MIDFDRARFKSDNEAVRYLYEKGVAGAAIAKALGIKRNAVHRCISDYRAKTGRYIKAIDNGDGLPVVVLEMPVDELVEDWAMFNYLKSVNGAREAREAIHE